MPGEWAVRRSVSRRSINRRSTAAVLTAVVVTAVVVTAGSLTAQSPGAADLASRFAAFTAVTGYEQAVADSLVALLPGSVKDRAGNVVLTLGHGAPRRLAVCPLDETGYIVGNITADGYLTLRRLGRPTVALFDQQLEGHRVTLFGRRGPVPGVVAVKSTHLQRGRPTAAEPPFTVDDAYVDVGAASAAEARALGLDVLTPVALTKRPLRYGEKGGLLAAPNAGRRAACAALAAAVLAKPNTKGTVVVAFTVQSLQTSDAGLNTVKRLLGPFDDVTVAGLTAKFPDTAVETVTLSDVDALMRRLEGWMRGAQ
jgi:putative aminopeptidase